MKTDPRKACANQEERVFWAWLHDAVAHPLMAFTGWSKWSQRIHDWTSERAWPRERELVGDAYLHPTERHGVLVVREVPPKQGFWKIQHGRRDREVVIRAPDAQAAAAQAAEMFDWLEVVD